jgi:hypothetical protein
MCLTNWTSLAKKCACKLCAEMDRVCFIVYCLFIYETSVVIPKRNKMFEGYKLLPATLYIPKQWCWNTRFNSSICVMCSVLFGLHQRQLEQVTFNSYIRGNQGCFNSCNLSDLWPILSVYSAIFGASNVPHKYFKFLFQPHRRHKDNWRQPIARDRGLFN